MAGRRVIYLDMNMWVNMSKGLHDEDECWAEVVDQLVHFVNEGRCIVPLSAAHYLELWHRVQKESRESVGRVMRDVSRYLTILSPHMVRQLEAQALALSWTDGIWATVQEAIVGYGASHAFGRPEGRFRFVESVASSDGTVPEGAAVAPEPGWDRPVRESGLWEWYQLVGHQAQLENQEGLDRAPEHRFGATSLESELRLRDTLRARPLSPARLRDLMVVQEYESMHEYILAALTELGYEAPTALISGGLAVESAPYVRDVIRAMPSANVWSTLRFLKHRDFNLPWEQHDWTDLWALSVAIPYCDAVITEKRWAHLAGSGGLSAQYNTIVTAGLSGLQTVLNIEGHDR